MLFVRAADMNKVGKIVEYNTNDVILDRECIDRNIFIILSGRAEIVEINKNYTNQLIAGSIIGGIPVLQDNISLYTLRALEDKTSVFEISSSTYESLITKCPDLYIKIFINLLNKVRNGIDELNETDSVAATLYKLNATYERVNLLKDSDVADLVFNDLNYTIFVMRFLSDLSIKLKLPNVF